MSVECLIILSIFVRYYKSTIMENQQLYSLSREQLQVFLTAKIGDGGIYTSNSNSTYYCTNCKYEEYIDFKSQLLGDLFKSKTFVEENGYSRTSIYCMRSRSCRILPSIRSLSLKDTMDKIDDLGIALWIYDNGSLHKNEMYYNISTHRFSREDQEQAFIPFFNRIGVFPEIEVDRKKDGRIFYYLRIKKYKGAKILSDILSGYPLNCYSYKRWSSETNQKWCKFQEELKRTGKEINSMSGVKLGCIWREISL